jgi:hypothetical protein
MSGGIREGVIFLLKGDDDKKSESRYDEKHENNNYH